METNKAKLSGFPCDLAVVGAATLGKIRGGRLGRRGGRFEISTCWVSAGAVRQVEGLTKAVRTVSEWGSIVRSGDDGYIAGMYNE